MFGFNTQIYSNDMHINCAMYKQLLHGGLQCFHLYLLCCAETHIPLIQTESLGSKVIGSEPQTTHRNYNFLSEINRWDF